MLILGLQKTTLLDYPHKVASTIFTGGCNFRCPFCHNGDLVVNPAALPRISEVEVLEHLYNKRKVLDGVCITGGEPTLQSDLYSFISRIKEYGLLVKLDTNGTNPKVLKELLDDHLIDYVAMDIKTSREKYNEIAQMTNFDISLIEESVELLMNSTIDYEFRTTVVNELHTIEDFQKIGEWIMGAKAYYIQPFRMSSQVINPVYSSPSKSELDAIISTVSPYIMNSNIRGVD